MKFNLQKKLISLVLPLLLMSVVPTSHAQQDREDLRPIDRIFFGGNFGLLFGTITDIEISPLVGYYITPRLAAGLGGRFEYLKNKGYVIQYETTIYGGSLFSRYIVIRDIGQGINVGLNTGIFAQAEYEMLSLDKEYFNPYTSEPGRFLEHSVLVGGGIIQPIGRRSALLFTILYNLNESSHSPYSNPIIRLGFTF